MWLIIILSLRHTLQIRKKKKEILLKSYWINQIDNMHIPIMEPSSVLLSQQSIVKDWYVFS